MYEKHKMQAIYAIIPLSDSMTATPFKKTDLRMSRAIAILRLYSGGLMIPPTGRMAKSQRISITS